MELLFSHSVMSNTLQPHVLHHPRPPCLSLTPRVCSNSCPLSWWSIQPFHPLSFPSPPALNLSQHQGFFQWTGSLHQVAKVLELQVSISPSNEYLELNSFRIDCFDLLAVQGTLKSFLQHHNSKASIVWCSAFYMVRLSHLYMTTGKAIVLTRWTFVSKVMSLLFNLLSRFIIAFLSRNHRLESRLWKEILTTPVMQMIPL